MGGGIVDVDGVYGSVAGVEEDEGADRGSVTRRRCFVIGASLPCKSLYKFR